MRSRKGTQIFDPKGKFQYDVAVACSGIRSLVSLIALTTIYGFVSFKALWKRALMVLIAFPLAIIGRQCREDYRGDYRRRSLWTGNWLEVTHGAGFVTFAVAIICVMILSHWLREAID